jgi:fatty-acyl-CoA synthase
MIQSFFNRLNRTSYTLLSIYDAQSRSIAPISSDIFLTECRRWADLINKRSETVVTIFGHTNPDMISAWFGAILAGKLPAFISYPSSKIQGEAYQEKIANYRERFGACCFIGMAVDRPLCRDMLTPEDRKKPSSTPLSAYPGMNKSCNLPLFLQCSSGSTGLQKAVAITGHNLDKQIQSYQKVLRLIPKKDHIINWLPLYHDMGLITAHLLPLLTETAITHVDTFDWAANPDCFLQLLEEQNGTLCWLPNFAFSFLSRSKKNYNLSKVRSFINCSEPVSINSFQRFCTTFTVRPEQLGISYALAENVFAATQTPMGQPPAALLVDKRSMQRRIVKIIKGWNLGDPPPHELEQPVFSCGMALDSVQVQIKTRRDSEQVGEVLLAGESTVAGYHDQPPIQEQGWLATGDLGFIHQGELYICGRSKDLIIHNGKNIYPQDLEEVVNQHPLVHAGRVAALGCQDSDLDSEKIQVLFEPQTLLSLKDRNRLRAQLCQKLEALFDIRAEVVCVPKGWLHKTSSGKISRSACRDSFNYVQEGNIHLVGDSHVRLFWTTKTSHHNRFKRLHAHWIGLLWSDNWKKSFAFFGKLIPKLERRDILIIHCGEPECRTIFAASDNPEARIEQSITQYREFFSTLKQVWPGRVAYMTGIPTHPENIDNKDIQWPITDKPEARYRYQKIFYEKMQTLCAEVAIQFLDVCTPLLEKDGFMDPKRLVDAAHLHRNPHTDIYWSLFEERFGYLDDQANEPPVESQRWDGSYEHYLQLVKKKIRTMAPLNENPDWNRLISSGVLDSLAIVELVAMLDQVCGFNIQTEEISRENFESIEGIYQRYGRGN